LNFLESASGTESESIIELSCGRFGHRIECLLKQPLAEQVLPHGLHPLAEEGVTAHECAVCVLSRRIVLEDERGVLEAPRAVDV
jgi:hypothetical protein